MKNLTQKLASGKLSLAEFAKEYWTICTTYLKATDKPGLSDTAQTDSLDLLRPALERMKIQPGEKQGEFLKWLTHSPLEVNPDIRDRVTEYLEYLYGGKAYDEDWNEVLQARIITNNLIAEEMLRGRNPEEITNEEIDRTFPNSMMKHFSDSQLAASILLSAGYVLVNGVWQKVSNRVIKGAGNVDNFIKSNVNPNFQQNVKNAFGSDAKVTTLTQDTTVYRYHGGTSSSKSYWYTPNQTSNPAADLALPQGNTYQYMDTYIIPKGTTILEGSVAPNFGQPGGGYQFYIPDPTVVIPR